MTAIYMVSMSFFSEFNVELENKIIQEHTQKKCGQVKFIIEILLIKIPAHKISGQTTQRQFQVR